MYIYLIFIIIIIIIIFILFYFIFIISDGRFCSDFPAIKGCEHNVPAHTWEIRAKYRTSYVSCQAIEGHDWLAVWTGGLQSVMRIYLLIKLLALCALKYKAMIWLAGSRNDGWDSNYKMHILIQTKQAQTHKAKTIRRSKYCLLIKLNR